MKIKSPKHNSIKFKHNTIQFSSITSLIFILSSTPTQAMFKTPKILSGPDYGKNVRRLVSFFENTGTNISTPNTKLSSISKTSSKIKSESDSSIKTQSTSLINTLNAHGKTYVSKLHIQLSNKSDANAKINKQNKTSSDNKNNKSSINTAKYSDIFSIYTTGSTTTVYNSEAITASNNFKSKYNSNAKSAKYSDIFGIYTSGSTTTFYNTTTSNAASNFKSNYSPFKNDTTTANTKTISTLTSKNSTDNNNSFKLDLKINNNKKSQPLYFSEKRLQNLENEIKIFTASIIKENLPRGSSGKVELKFDQKLNKELNSILSRFIYKSAMDSIKGYLDNKNN